MTNGPTIAALALVTTLWPRGADAKDIDADPSTYNALLGTLRPGDTLHLAAGHYPLLPLTGVNGNPDAWITIAGPPGDPPPAVIDADPGPCCNTVEIVNSSYLAIEHLTIDGHDDGGAFGISAQGGTGNLVHDIRIEGCSIINHHGDQQEDAISTKTPTWGWIIRGNKILRAGTGLYLGNSDGSDPFVGGIIEDNLIEDPIGYCMEIKFQQPRPTVPGMPTMPTTTIVRDNVFIKNDDPSPDGDRPNLLVGGFPASGPGASDRYEIYGNFFFHNARESLLQASGRVTIHDNIFVDAPGNHAVLLRDQDLPLELAWVYDNTIYGAAIGIDFGTAARQGDLVAGNLVFADTPITGTIGTQHDNLTDGIANAAQYVNAPSTTLGRMDFYPRAGKCAGAPLDASMFAGDTDDAVDFNRAARGAFTERGAYAGEGVNPGWPLGDGIKTTGALGDGGATGDGGAAGPSGAGAGAPPGRGCSCRAVPGSGDSPWAIVLVGIAMSASVRRRRLRALALISALGFTVGCARPGGHASDAGVPVDAASGDASAACAGCPCTSGAAPTAFEQSLIDLPAHTWWQAPGSHMRDVCAPDSFGVGGIDGCGAVVAAWSGGAYDAVRDRMVVWGGGHADYWGNELYAFDLKSGTWSRLTDPSVVPPDMAPQDFLNRDPLPDGKPVSRHTYDGLQFLDDGTFFAQGGSRAGDGGGTNVTWLYHDGSGWTDVAVTGTAPGGYSMASGYDAASRSVLMRGAQFLSVYDVDHQAWTSMPGFGFPPLWPRYACSNDSTGVVDPKRHLFWAVGDGGVLVWDIAKGAPVTDAWVTSGAGAYTNQTCVSQYPDQLFQSGGGNIYDVAAPGIDYDVAADALVAWPNAGAPYELDLATRVWTAGGSDGAPTSKNSIGTYGRWRYIAADNVFILVNSVDENVYFYKNTAGCGPRA